MKQHIIELLAHPRYLVLDEIDITECPHHSYYDETDPRCKYCELGEECRWLTNNEAFIALTKKPVEDLVQSLEFAVDYTTFRFDHHNTRACICESCAWLREARHFLRQYSIEGFESPLQRA